ncbi:MULTISPECIES: cob(I)yrinic acid a,c-diamide adenosyltransferase [unclassified Beijerinckia]|uniref:cob(I)yrinic acid a,c-diamide adenosyltransferase n=1 Tax=unclassified Beijerinckia TaxID=2638183 RepID=UPI0008964CBD|nr:MULTISPECIES: cob(I)yrinic acid a,c-diamide adenosyltransferase [unclassified Beijerinckia]MDH7798068.1 cob(I)alamin adenosyltransferase [Beijerinckia sp. GAS462]SED07824.1 ATP:cob(I)alamin adenosyltransferase [Beijerinckia sp. 28-YEA-48]
MVVLSRIYTRTGDDGSTALGTGERRAKYDLRIEAFGTIDEANAAIGIARLTARQEDEALDAMLGRIQNDLFDLGADLCTPPVDRDLGYEPLRIIQTQVDRLEAEIDQLNSHLEPLRTFVLPGGTPTAAALHVARTVCRRAERRMVELVGKPDETVGTPAMKYVNRLSDLLFVASRYCNWKAQGDILWTPGKNR